MLRLRANPKKKSNTAFGIPSAQNWAQLFWAGWTIFGYGQETSFSIWERLLAQQCPIAATSSGRRDWFTPSSSRIDRDAI
ncbi:hypothetical protein MHBO_002725 [Bonamia ostreae]|uniref:Uncharacterized protein n=1 Tax=Bonamia ostreae TaxID=126728 RepID=A0ABV2ANA7_9EUKA